MIHASQLLLVKTRGPTKRKAVSRERKSGGWGYAVFNYEAALDKFTPDAKSPSDCGHTCHVAVKAKDSFSTRTKSVEPPMPPI
jgi:hypothetical protein